MMLKVLNNEPPASLTSPKLTLKTPSKKRRPDAVDKLVGLRIRELRHAGGISMKELAKHLDVSHQQVQKIESGENRISAGKLYLLSCLYKLPISYFFSSIKESHQQINLEKIGEISDDPTLSRSM